jgi:hypothetical protein
MDQHISAYLADNNTCINHLPMQDIALRPEPVFTLVSACLAASGDSLETRNYFASLAFMLEQTDKRTASNV